MSITISLGATSYIIPETDETDWGEQVTNFLVRTAAMLDGVSAFKSSISIPLMKSTTTALAAGATLTPTHPTHRVSGSGAAVTLSASTSIAAGTYNGELLRLEGDHATNTVTIQDASNVQLRGDITLGLYDTLDLIWDSTLGDWKETARKQGHRLMNQKGLELFEATANGSNKITIRAPAALAGDITWTLPAADSVGFFKSDGAGGMTIAAGTSTLDNAYDNGSTITVDASAITATVTAAINGIRIAKTNAGAGSPLSIDNDGTGPGIDVKQDGAEAAIDADRSLGGNVARFRTTGSGVSSSITVECDAQVRRAILGATSSGNPFVGSESAHPFEIRTTNVARITVASGASEIGVGGATASGVALILYGGSTPELRMAGTNGSGFGLHTKEILLSGFTGATMTASGAIPTSAHVIEINFRVNTTITGASTSFDCGVSGALTRYLNAIAPGNYGAGTQLGSAANGVEDRSRPYAAATDLIFTANGSNFSAGAVRISIVYFSARPPTS